MLLKVADERIFSIEKNTSGTFTLTEECDQYFSIELTASELMQLAQEIKMLLND